MKNVWLNRTASHSSAGLPLSNCKEILPISVIPTALSAPSSIPSLPAPTPLKQANSSAPPADNRIPTSRFDPVAVNAAKLWPGQNQVGQLNTNLNNLAIQKVPSSPTDRVDFKIDHNLSQNRRMFVRYNRFKQATGAADFWDNGAAPSDGIMYWGSLTPPSITLRQLALERC